MDGWFIRLTVDLTFSSVFWVHYRINRMKMLRYYTADTFDQKITHVRTLNITLCSCFGPIWHSLFLQQTGRRGRKAHTDRTKGGGAGRVPAHGRVNGHHPENGTEIMSLFEVVKLGKSATQVGKHSGWIISRFTVSDYYNDEDGEGLFFLLFFSLLLTTGLRHINMIVTSPFWTWLISLFSALAVKVSNRFFILAKNFTWEKWVNKWRHVIFVFLSLCDLKYRCCECRDVQTDAELWNHPENDRRVWWGDGLVHNFSTRINPKVFSFGWNEKWPMK